MFRRDASPIANVPVYKRIAIGSREPQPGDPNAPSTSTCTICDEHNRIWELVQQTASGVNPPAAENEYQAPEEDAA